MSFEILYKYHPKVGDEYDKTQVLEIKKRLGKEFEDVSLEKLATTIITQLARRDVLIVDVEIFESMRKQISFKETKGGILIKNKKFYLDGTIQIVEEEEISETPQVQQKTLPKLNQPVKWEIYDPEPTLVPILSKKYKLTPNKKYPVFEEKTVMQKVNLPTGSTELPTYEYLIVDDQGQKIKIPSMHFVPEQKPLVGMGNINYASNNNGLLYMNDSQFGGVPDIRR